ncbi:MAG: SpoIIE family protein phosphatase [Halioglobus sp.]
MTTSITARLILLLTLCSALVIGVGMLVDYRISREEIMTRLQIQLKDRVESALVDLENMLDGVEGSTLFLGTILRQREYSSAGLEQLLKDIVENNDDIFGSTIALNPELTETSAGFAPYYYHREGILTYVDLAKEQKAYWLQSWYKNAVLAEKPVWTEPYFDRGGGEILMTTFSVPIYRTDKSGSRFLYGVATGDVALDELHNYMQRIRLGENGFGILLSRAGIVISAREPQSILKDYRERVIDPEDIPIWEELFQSVLKGNAITRTLECEQIDGECSIRMATLTSTGWPVGVIYSQGEVLKPLQLYQLKTAIVGLVTLLLMSLSIYAITRRLTGPLSALANASKDLASGKLNTALPHASGNDEVASLIRAFTNMQRDLKVYIADLEDATASRSRLEGELAAAREIQMSMLPQGGEAQETCETYSLWAKVRPAKSVGGDLYTYYERHGELFVAVGDVSDKGVPAALFMAKAISLMQQLQEDFSEPNTGMAKLNDLLEQGNENCMFLTLFFGVLNLQTGTLRFASGGHTPPTLLQAGRATTLEQKSGPALGLATEQTFPINTVQLPAGSRLAIYTDGIDEAFDSEAQMFGTQRINAQIEKDVDQATASAGMSLFQAVDAFAGSTPQSDDITLLLLDWSAATVHAHEFAQQHALHLGPKLVTRANLWLEHVLEQAGVSPDVIMELTLVLEEMVTNVGKYSGLDQTSELQVLVAGNSAEISLEIQDQGSPFDPLSEARRAELGQDIDHAQVGGLGVHLITQLTQRQDYRREEGKNILRVIKQLDT